ncbi:TetR/AcrR family transcriptional regulator [Paenibacillus sp. sptzw28]|uniref:TetR/AcrR family transcriptional regulator n=1 Tax=Paenibacillus sp. sptzw28 TaxID=715179 RepID=UPI001C6DDAD9|nr:TetR/AcrR family transcriptional regulator [Paenibacillus sp. sptzw28]QYR22714.1 TetR/AcrR family transcriptional regulator [Paenibacillus sp. sptzw28]
MSRTAGNKSAAREQLLHTASRLFFERGFHAVGVDTIVAESGITKMTMYKHFPSKDHLIVEILERSSEIYWDWFESVIQGISEPQGQLTAIFDAVAKGHSNSPRSTYCLYQNVAVEFPDPEHIANQAAVVHKQSIVNRLQAICERAGLKSPDTLARQLFVLLEGFCISSRFFGADSPAADVVLAAKALVDMHRQ